MTLHFSQNQTIFLNLRWITIVICRCFFWIVWSAEARFDYENYVCWIFLFGDSWEIFCFLLHANTMFHSHLKWLLSKKRWRISRGHPLNKTMWPGTWHLVICKSGKNVFMTPLWYTLIWVCLQNTLTAHQNLIFCWLLCVYIIRFFYFDISVCTQVPWGWSACSWEKWPTLACLVLTND